MSDTPRTDNCLTEILDAFGYVHQGNCPQRWVNHARELERELNVANQRIKRLEEAIQERDKEWFQVIESILGFHPVSMTEALRIGIERIKKQKQRIKRLEEALEECDWAFTKFCPEHESRYGDAWEKVRDALNRPNPFKPYWQEAKP